MKMQNMLFTTLDRAVKVRWKQQHIRRFGVLTL